MAAAVILIGRVGVVRHAGPRRGMVAAVQLDRPPVRARLLLDHAATNLLRWIAAATTNVTPVPLGPPAGGGGRITGVEETPDVLLQRLVNVASTVREHSVQEEEEGLRDHRLLEDEKQEEAGPRPPPLRQVRRALMNCRYSMLTCGASQRRENLRRAKPGCGVKFERKAARPLVLARARRRHLQQHERLAPRLVREPQAQLHMMWLALDHRQVQQEIQLRRRRWVYRR